MNQLKVCAKCKQIKPVSAFGTDKTHKSGLQSWCRLCKAAWARQCYTTPEGKAAHKKAHKKWYRAAKGKTNREWQAELLSAAQEILYDFNTYGEVLQVGDNGEYGTESAIGRLSVAVHGLE